MILPSLTPSELDITDLVGGDRLLEVSTPPSSPSVPFAIISKTTIYVLVQSPLTIVASYVRTQELVQNYGENVLIKTCDDTGSSTRFFVVETSRNFLMTYSVTDLASLDDPRYELMRVFADLDHLIQEVYPVDKSASFFGFGFGSLDHQTSKINGSDFSEDAFEDASWNMRDSRFRFRMVLRVQCPLIGYTLLPGGVLCVLTRREERHPESAPKKTEREEGHTSTENITFTIQRINLKSQSVVSSHFLDELPWFAEPSTSSDILHFSYCQQWDSFLLVTGLGNCWMFRSDLLEGACVYGLGDAVTVLPNEAFHMLLVVTKDNDIFYYRVRNLEKFSVQLTKRFKKPLNLKRLIKIKILRRCKFLVVLYSNGWCILSVYGNITFLTFDYDDSLGVMLTGPTTHNWLTKVTDVEIFARDSHIIVVNEYGVYTFPLMKWACADVQSDAVTKRPVLTCGTMLYVYSGKISNSPELYSRFNVVDMPLPWYSLVNPIYFASALEEGDYLAVYGGAGSKNLAVYSFETNNWLVFSDSYYDQLYIQCNVLWWGEFVFIDNYNVDEERYEILMLNVQKVFSSLQKCEPDFVGRTKANNVSVKFDLECIIWRYELGADAARYMNVDALAGELVALTRADRLMVFSLEQKTVARTEEESKVYRKQVQIKLVVKALLANLSLGAGLGNLNVVRVSRNLNNMLLLENGNLYLLDLVKDEHSVRYEAHLVYNNIEFLNKVDDGKFYFFNGDDILYAPEVGVDRNGGSVVTQIASWKLLRISNFDEQFYPVAVNLGSEYYVVGLSVDVMRRRTGGDKALRLVVAEKFFLHDLLRFEIGLVAGSEKLIEDELQTIYQRYRGSGNFEYSLELLLYMVATNNNENEKVDDAKLGLLLQLIKKVGHRYLSIIAKCLRKIEVEYWDRIFAYLKISARELFRECVEIRDYRTAGYYLIILLSYNKSDSEEISSEDKEEIMNFLKIIADNFGNPRYDKNKELWDMGIELIRFLKVLDGSGDILRQSIDTLIGKK